MRIVGDQTALESAEGNLEGPLASEPEDDGVLSHPILEGVGTGTKAVVLNVIFEERSGLQGRRMSHFEPLWTRRAVHVSVPYRSDIAIVFVFEPYIAGSALRSASVRVLLPTLA